MYAPRAILFATSVIFSTALLAAASNVGGASPETRLEAMCKVMEVSCSGVGNTNPVASSASAQTQDPIAAAFMAHVNKQKSKVPGSGAQQKAKPLKLSLCPNGLDSCLGDCSQYDPGNPEDGGTGAYAGCVLSCYAFCLL